MSDRDRFRAEQRRQEAETSRGFLGRAVRGVPGAVVMPSGSVYRHVGDTATLRRYVPKPEGGGKAAKRARREARAAARAQEAATS